MKLFLVLIYFALLSSIAYSQEMRVLIADGTKAIPDQSSFQTQIEDLSDEEIEFVKTEAFEIQTELKYLPPISASETKCIGKFKIIDIADGFFISRELESRAFLYTAWDESKRRNYQGIIVVENFENNTKFRVAAHYAYQFKNDEFIRQLSDIDGNILSELAVFDKELTKSSIIRHVRIIEFSPNGIEKFGSKIIYKQPLPLKSNEPANPIAHKLFALKNFNKLLGYDTDQLQELDGVWTLQEKSASNPAKLEIDSLDYFEQVKPRFPKILRSN